jgi:putative CocE/NonD family hydrolase
MRRSEVDPLPSPVTLFVMGGGSGKRTAEGRLDHGGRWRRAREWPLPEARPTAFHLHGSGELAAESSAEAEAFLEYDYDPLRPTPTIGGAIASGAPIMQAGAFDQREGPEVFGCEPPYRALADRPDVLVFRTPALTADLEVIGEVELDLWISSSCVDTDFVFKLIDEHPPSDDYPDGFAMNLTHGILRARYREGFEHEAFLEPGQVHQLRLRGFPTANRFLRGHRIRLDVGSSNYPHFDANPNSGEPEGYSFEPRAARNRVFMDRAHPSRLLLPVVVNR